jgi:BirA family biotin operon repressor/biotin-[acetyl-CoA-carboxylase] ligase
MGRSWLSNPGNVYAAVKLDPKGPFAGLSAGLNLAAILAQELDELIIKKEGPKLNCQGPLVMIKWPNDLIYQGRKVGGILLENRKGELIAGVGLNLIAPPPDALSREPWAPPAGAINSDLGSAEDLWPLLAYKILISYNEYFASYGENKSLIGKANILSRLLGLGQMAEVHGPSCSPSVKIPRLFGRITGLTEEGALIMEGPDGPLTVWSGVLVLSMRNFQLHD